MILKPEVLVTIKQGRPWFMLPVNPGWEIGRVVTLRESGADSGIKVTIREIVQRGGGFRIAFTFGDSRPERRFLAAGWPDYTADASRAMPNEKPPVPETGDERKERSAWLRLRGLPSRPQFIAPRAAGAWKPVCKREGCGNRLEPPEKVPYAERERPRYCSDKCLLLDTYEGRRGA